MYRYIIFSKGKEKEEKPTTKRTVVRRARLKKRLVRVDINHQLKWDSTFDG